MENLISLLNDLKSNGPTAAAMLCMEMGVEEIKAVEWDLACLDEICTAVRKIKELGKILEKKR